MLLHKIHVSGALRFQSLVLWALLGLAAAPASAQDEEGDESDVSEASAEPSSDAAPPIEGTGPPAVPPAPAEEPAADAREDPAASDEGGSDERPDEPEEPEEPATDVSSPEAAAEEPYEEEVPLVPVGEPIGAATTLPVRISGYVDFGFFFATGTGAGHRQDLNHQNWPQHRGIGWVFWGDPLSTAINSRGDPASTGDEAGRSRAIVDDFIGAGGNSSFLVNEVNLELMSAPHRDVWLLTSIDFLPRGRNISRPDEFFLGDHIDVDLAFLNWTAFATMDHVLDVQVGKFDSVMGIEYRIQESPDRFGVTPSLIFRYTGGNPLGLKARGRFLQDHVNVAVALTNGSHFRKNFPFFDEINTNPLPTGAGRIGFRYDGFVTAELGFSGLVGAQDQQPDPTTLQWQAGADLNVLWEDLELRAEYQQGAAMGAESRGTPCLGAPCLDFRGAYGELSYRLFNWFGAMARLGWREAQHRDSGDFLYLVNIMRATVGARFEINRHLILKLEYLHNRELAELPQIDNDVFTSSLVITL